MSDNFTASNAESGLSSSTRSRHGSSRSGRSHSARSSKSSQRLMLAIALVAALIALLAVTIFFSLRVAQLSKLNDSMSAELAENKVELLNIKPKLEQVQQELQQIVKGRLPRLHDMQPDKVIPVDKGYLKNIVFTIIKSNHQKEYEYKLVLENTGSSKIFPNARVLLFNKLGVQIGMDEINEHNELAPGESRSHSASINLSIDDEPHYFFVDGKTQL
jgi:hypothetical protein